MLTEKMPRGYNQYPRVTSYSSLQSSTSITSPKIPFKKKKKKGRTGQGATSSQDNSQAPVKTQEQRSKGEAQICNKVLLKENHRFPRHLQWQKIKPVMFRQLQRGKSMLRKRQNSQDSYQVGVREFCCILENRFTLTIKAL